MKLKEAREFYYDRSGLASDSARQLAFAGIAVVWILATNDEAVAVEANSLRLPLLAFVLALALDLIQYYAAALFWGVFSRVKEKGWALKKIKKWWKRVWSQELREKAKLKAEEKQKRRKKKKKTGDKEIGTAPRWANWVPFFCFCAKGAMVAVGYFWLAELLWSVLFATV